MNKEKTEAIASIHSRWGGWVNKIRNAIDKMDKYQFACVEDW